MGVDSLQSPPPNAPLKTDETGFAKTTIFAELNNESNDNEYYFFNTNTT